MKTPCEYTIWNVLPSIRKELVKSLMRNHELNQKQTASMLGLSEAAVCQYLSNKRGGEEIKDDYLLREIDKSARIIYNSGSKHLIGEICRICNLWQSKNEILIDEKCGKGVKEPCETVVWDVLPVIRKEVAKKLIEKHGFTQRKVAQKLGLTEAAVSRYLSKKRGKRKITNQDILHEMDVSSDLIVNGNDETVNREICRICNLFKSEELLRGDLS